MICRKGVVSGKVPITTLEGPGKNMRLFYHHIGQARGPQDLEKTVYSDVALGWRDASLGWLLPR